MAIYPQAETDRRVPREALLETVTRVFVGCGMSDADAGLLAETLVSSDMRGVHSHGVLRVPDYVAKLTREGADPAGRPRIVSRKGGAIRVDGGNSMGQIGGTFAMDAAIEAARETGIAFAALGNSNHCSGMDWYTMRAARAGMIGLAGTNAIPTMAPLGGTDRIELTNMIIEVAVTNAYSKGGIPLTVNGVANIKIPGELPLLHNALERFLGRTRQEIMQVARETLEGNLRGVLATLTPEQVNQDKEAFALKLTEEAEHDLNRMGLVLDTLKIQNVSDDVGYLDDAYRRSRRAIESLAGALA